MKIEPLFHTHDYPVYDKDTAMMMGYESLTIPYQTDSNSPLIRRHENHLWELQCYQMRGCKCVAVLVENGLEMWRHTSELNIDPETGLKRNTMMATKRK
jgi:hypothetical protein